MTPRELVRFIESRRWPLSSESQIQELFANELRAAGHQVAREVRLSPEERIDVMVGSIGVEIKLNGQARSIYRQCERYCMFDSLDSLVLATSISMGMPHDINGKPILVASLSRGWV